MIIRVSKETSAVNRLLSRLTDKPVRMALELNMFDKYCSVKDGLEFFRTRFNAHHDGDHTPAINLVLGAFNFTIIDLHIYNVFHDEDLDETVEDFIASLKRDDDINSEDDIGRSSECPDKI